VEEFPGQDVNVTVDVIMSSLTIWIRPLQEQSSGIKMYLYDGRMLTQTSSYWIKQLEVDVWYPNGKSYKVDFLTFPQRNGDVNQLTIYNRMGLDSKIVYDGKLLPEVTKVSINTDEYGNPTTVSLRITIDADADDGEDKNTYIWGSLENGKVRIQDDNNYVTPSIPIKYYELIKHYFKHKLE